MGSMRLVTSLTLAFLLCASAARAALVLDQAFGDPASNRFGVAYFFTTPAFPQYGIPSNDQAQTFTVGVAGSLVGAGMWLGACCPDPNLVVTEPLQIQLRRTVNGVPSNDPADVLSSVYLTQAQINAAELDDPNHRGYGWFLLSFSSAPAVSIGDVLALVMVHYGTQDPNLQEEQVYKAQGDYTILDNPPYTVPMYDGGEALFASSADGVWKPQGTAFEAWDMFFATYVQTPEPAGAWLSALALLIPFAARSRSD